MKTLERRRIDEIARELESGAYGLALARGLDAASAERILLEAFTSLAPSLPRTTRTTALREALYARIRQRAPRQEWVGASSEPHPVPAAAVSESLHIRAVDLLEEHQADEPIERRRAMLGGFIGAALVAGLVAFFWTHADALASARPTVNELSPAAFATDVPLSGDVRVKFGRRPTGIPTLRLEPAHVALESAHWDGDTLVAVYTGLHLSSRYQIVLQANYRSRLNDLGHYEKRWQVTTRGYPALATLQPAQGDTQAPRAGRIAADFSYAPPATPRITITPADGVVGSGEWSGTTFTAAYSGLKPLTRYEATLTLDFGAAGAQMQRQWSFTTEPGWPPSRKPVIWYATTNLWNLPNEQRLVAIDWQGTLAGTAYPGAAVLQQSPDGSALLTQDGGYVDSHGLVSGAAGGSSSMTLAADDSKSACRLVGNGQLWLETGPLGGPMHRVAPAGSTGARSGIAILACSVTSDRAVIADNGVGGTTTIHVVGLTTGRLLYQRWYGGANVWVTSSRDGRYVAEQTSTYDAQHQVPVAFTTIRRTLDGAIVARLDNRRVLRFSWDSMRVITVAAFAGNEVTLLDWQTGKVLWRQASDASDGRPAYATAQPHGPAMAVALGSQVGRGEVDRLWIVSADGQATQVVSSVFYPVFGSGF